MNASTDSPNGRAAQALAAAGLDERHLGALQAFAQAITPEKFEEAFAQRFLALASTPPSPEQAVFLGHLIERDRWGDPKWLVELTDTWNECGQAGLDDELLATAGSCLIEAVQDVLCTGCMSQPVREIVRASARLGHAVHSMLAMHSYEQLNHRLVAGEGIDPVTGLLARARFLQLLDRTLSSAETRPLGLVIVHVNLGSERGGRHDRLRWQLTKAMEKVLRPADTLCAASEYEWALVMPDLVTSAQIHLAAARLVEACEGLSAENTPSLRGEVHAGAACGPDDGDSSGMLERAARAALHRGLRTGVPVVRFASGMVEDMARELELEREISQSIRRPPFMVWLQPQVHLDSGRCAGAEALIRWQRGDGSWVPPPEIISMAMRLGLMPDVSRWIMAQVVRMARDLGTAGIDIPISLNLVAGDLYDADLPALVEQTLAAWGVAPQRLVLEVTEGALIEDRQRASGVISALRELGCGVSLDDFGTGFSSFAYMRDLPVSELKIDQLFVRDMLRSPRDQAIVAAVLALSRGFGLTVVAEGVEDADTAQALKALGCDHAQGFLYGRAMAIDDFIAWAHQHHASIDSRAPVS